MLDALLKSVLFCFSQKYQIEWLQTNETQSNLRVASPFGVLFYLYKLLMKVAVHSGGKHAMALTVDGRVFSWGEGDDGKLGHCSRIR